MFFFFCKVLVDGSVLILHHFIGELDVLRCCEQASRLRSVGICCTAAAAVATTAV